MSAIDRADVPKIKRSKLARIAERVAARYKKADVTTTIIQQMGGGRLKAMLGARLIRIPNGLAIQWPNKQPSRGNYVEVVLRGDDTYDMTFFNASVRGKKQVKEYHGVYADQLVDLFEQQTGWYLRLAGVRWEKAWGDGLVAKVVDPEGLEWNVKVFKKVERINDPESGKWKVWFDSIGSKDFMMKVVFNDRNSAVRAAEKAIKEMLSGSEFGGGIFEDRSDWRVERMERNHPGWYA